MIEIEIPNILYEDIYLSESYLVGLFWNNPDLYAQYDEDKINTDNFGSYIWRFFFHIGRELFKQKKRLFDDITVEEYIKINLLSNKYEEFGEYQTMYEVVSEVKDKEENFEGYLNEVKKYMLLRKFYVMFGSKVLEKQGKYDYKLLNAEQIGRYWLDKVNSECISIDGGIEEFDLLDDLEDFIVEIDENPDIGLPFYNSKHLNDICNGEPLGTLYALGGASGLGKCVHGDTYIYTDRGMIKIKDIPKHFNVTSSECQANVVSYDIHTAEKKNLKTSHFYNMGESDTIKIKTTRGYEIEGTHEHPVVVLNKSGNIEFKKLQEVASDDIIAISRNNNMWGKIHLNYDEAYLLGVLTGDGNLNGENRKTKSFQIGYSKGDPYMYGKINNILKSRFDIEKIRRVENSPSSTDHFFGNKELYYRLKTEYGLSMTTAGYKKVPHTILSGDKSTVKAYLQGLFDTDASMDKERCFQFSTKSKDLAKQVHLLLLNFGIYCTLREKKVKKYPDNIYYVIDMAGENIHRFAREIGFRYCKKKQGRLLDALNKPINPNIGVVYNQKERLRMLHTEWKLDTSKPLYNCKDKYKMACYDGENRGVQNALQNNKNCSSYALRKILSSIPKMSEEERYLYNLSQNMFFDTIKAIDKSRAVVYDFTVPSTHSFVSNGFISHNTTFAMNKVILSWLLNDEKGIVIANEMGIKAYKKLLLVTIMGNEMYSWFQEKGYKPFKRQNIDRGGLSGEDKDKLREAVRFLNEKNKNKKLIKFVPLDTYTQSNVEKTIRYYANRGYKRIIIDTMKPTEGGRGDRWVQFVQDYDMLYKLARPNGGGLNLAIFTPVQIADEFKRRRYLDDSCFGDSKKIKNVMDVTFLLRSVWDDEKEGGKKELKCWRYEKALFGEQPYIKQCFRLDKNKTYVIVFTGKNRRGMSNETGLPQLIYEVDYNRNSWKEVGWTNVPKDF